MSDAERALLRELVQAVPPPSPGRRRRRRRSEGSDATSRISASLPAELGDQFRTLCKVQDRRQRRVLEELVRAYVAQHAHLL